MSGNFYNCPVIVNPKLLESLLTEIKTLNSKLEYVRSDLSDMSKDYNTLRAEFAMLRSQLITQMVDNDVETVPDFYLKSLNVLDGESGVLSNRSLNCLMRAGVHSIADILLLDRKTLSSIRNLGEHSVENIKEFLAGYDLTLPEDNDNYKKVISLCDGDFAVTLTANSTIPKGTVVTVKEVFKPQYDYGRQYRVLPVYSCEWLGHSRVPSIYSVSQIRKV